MPNQHSKTSRDLCNIVSQINSGKNRNGCVLSHREVETLGEKRDVLKQEIEDRRIARVNSHTIQIATRVIGEVKKRT